MSDATDPDAWATACQEDLAAEQARRQERYGPPPLDPAQELRRLADAVTEQIGRIGAGFGLGTAPLASQARAALEPVIERNSEVFRHLAAAGQELLAAYRSAVEDHERSWARPADGRPGRELPPPRRTEKPAGDEAADSSEDGSEDGSTVGSEDEPPERRDEPPGPAGPQRIDLD